MFKNWSVGRRLFSGFALVGLTLLVVAGVSYRNITGLIENDARLEHSRQVRNELATLLSMIKDAETGQRGFLLTDNDSYLEPYETALRDVKGTLSDTVNLTADDPNQQRRLAALSPLIDSKLAELKQTIDVRKTQGFDAAVKIVLNDRGKVFMDQIRALVADADQETVDLLKQHAKDARDSASTATAIILWGGTLGTLAVAVIEGVIIYSLSRRIGGAASQVQDSSSHLQAAATQQNVGAKQQATAMTEIATTISELLMSSRQIAESVQRVAESASQTAGSAQVGNSTADLTNGSIEGIRRQVDQIVAHMLVLEKKSQEIDVVLDIASELADQTNILSINATIEAAGAGDKGERFAVVAEQIRSLADRVSGSTKEIGALIEDVRSAVNTTVMAIESGSKAVDAGSRRFADVTASFGRIAALAGTTAEAAREIQLSTKQQTTAVEQVKVAITQIAQTSAEAEASAGQIGQTVSRLFTLSHDLLRIIKPKFAA